MTGLLLSDDLLFASRITATARAQGLTVAVASSPTRLVEMAAASPPASVILDLQNTGLDLPTLLAELRAACPVPPRVVGYGSHVDAVVLKAARVAGVDPVLPRSKFAAMLEARLAGWLTPAASE